MKLVIVESPTKVKKIQQYLGSGYDVDSCVGHVRDLPSNKSEIPDEIKDEPWSDFGIDVEHGFKPYYVTIRGKGKVIQQLKKKLKDADELYLATDEDREGESISWHLVQALQPKVPVKRMVFNEITKKAIQEAIAHPRDIDDSLVQAQETRRILDRLYGYALSPLLWKKVGGNLSAGRVQSVAVRLVVLRERERMDFTAASYWDLSATLRQGEAFEARLVALEDQRVATGKDFGDDGKLIAGRDVAVLDEARARELAGRLRHREWTVSDVQQEERQGRPKAPFITSTLQQEANNRLNMSAKDAMRTAQRLYENGFITYMRTDSTALSQEAVEGARNAIRAEFGDTYLPSSPREYPSKKKGAQEAHEAIRPAGTEFIHPDRSGLSGADKSLYRLVWQRTLACQMENERYTQTTARIDVEEARFSASGKVVTFPGYRAVYAARGDDSRELPPLSVGDHPECQDVQPEGHETKPPSRFTEASLVQALESEGIGRPSTYAAILDTILNRGYVVRKGKALVPTFTAFAVTGLLEKHFPDLVDPAFTAKMESVLDEIASGEAEWVPFLDRFFRGPDGLQAQIEERLQTIDPEQARIIDIGDHPFKLRIGRFGPYVEGEVDGEQVRASLPEELTPDELDGVRVAQLLRSRAEGPQSIGELGGEPIYIMEGRYGPYYQLGDGDKPKRASLPKGKTPADADLEEATFLLSLPRELGTHPEGGRVLANVGRYGPYVAHEKRGDAKPEFRSLKDEAHLRSVDLDEALQILATPNAGRRGASVLRELGPHPDDGKPVQVLEGRYGPYVKHDKTNATIPKGQDPQGIDMPAAVRLLAERKGKGGKRARKTAKSAKSASAKKSAKSARK